jgi:hypothetical protein
VFDFTASKLHKSKVFRIVTTSIGVFSFVACANSKTPNSVTWTKASTHLVQPVDLYNYASDENGSNAAGYLSLGLVSLKSLTRAQNIVTQKTADPTVGTKSCQTVTATPQTDGTTQYKISTTGKGACANWNNNETITAATSKAGVITSLKKSDAPNAPGIAYAEDPAKSPRAVNMDLTETYTLKQAGSDATKPVYTFVYDGTVDNSYTQILATTRPVNKAHGIGNGQGHGANNATAQRQSANMTPGNQSRDPNAPNPRRSNLPDDSRVVKGSALKNNATIHAEGTLDFTDAQKPVVSYTKLTVGVEFTKDNDDPNSFTSDISLAQSPTAAMAVNCGAPEGSMSLVQNFSLTQAAKNLKPLPAMHPTLNLKGGKIVSPDSTTLDLGCSKTSGLSDLKDLVSHSSHHIYSVHGTKKKSSTLQTSSPNSSSPQTTQPGTQQPVAQPKQQTDSELL